MTITFPATTELAWQDHWRSWTRLSLGLALKVCILPLLAFGICYLTGFGLLLSKISAAVVGIVPISAGALAFLDLLRTATQWKKEMALERVAEIGKFDFRWGRQGAPGYYYHWSSFAQLTDKDGFLFFALNSGEPFRIPRQVFSTSDEADQFFALACHHWKAAKQNQWHTTNEQDATIWPPPPRLGA